VNGEQRSVHGLFTMCLAHRRRLVASVRRVQRRSLTVLPAVVVAVGLSAVASGCGTVSDRDVVARVDDVSLSREEFADQLVELGATSANIVPGDPARAELTRWIQSQLVDEAAAAEVYDAGTMESNALCIDAIVVADEATAEQVAAALDGGADFGQEFTANNIDTGLAATEGEVQCIVGEQLVAAGSAPFVQVAANLTAADPLGTAPIIDPQGTELAWVVMQFRTFADLSPEDVDVVVGVIPAGDRAADADIFVDPRFGTYDRTLARVVPLG
jgi:hypothetical protein